MKMGTIVLFAADMTPLDWLPCDGRTLKTSENGVLSVTLNAQGSYMFDLPNRDPLGGCKYILCVNGYFNNHIIEGFDSEDFEEATIGMITPFDGEAPPQNWAWCDGAEVSITQDPEIFSLVGGKFGFGSTNDRVKLPNLNTGETKYIIRLKGMYPES